MKIRQAGACCAERTSLAKPSQTGSPNPGESKQLLEIVMSAAETLLKSVIGIAFGELKDVILKDYFPDTFEKSVFSGLSDLSSKMDGIGQDVAYLRIYPVTSSLASSADYFTKTFLTKIEYMMKDKEANKEAIIKESKTLYNNALLLRASFVNGQTIFTQRLATADFPSRILFDALCAVAALHLSMLSWAFILKEADAKGDADRHTMAVEYAAFRNEALTFLSKCPHNILHARLNKVRFEKTIRMHKMVPNRLDYVRVLYADDFESHFDGDPFRGDRIYKFDEKEMTWHDISFLEDAKLKALAIAERNAREWEAEKDRHLVAVTALANTHVLEPFAKFMLEYDHIPAKLREAVKPALVRRN